LPGAKPGVLIARSNKGDTMQCTRIAPAARIAAVLIALGFLLVPASNATADGRRASASERLLIPSAGWHGRSIQRPHRHTTVPASSADSPLSGWSAGPVSMGTGSHRPSGSQRVREVQRRLRTLGYRPGPIDGIFGPRTRAAVAWFQVKHGFHVDGRATVAVVRHMRARATPAARSRAVEHPFDAYRQLGAWQPSTGVSVDDATPNWWLPTGLALLAFAIGFAAVAVLQRPGRAPEAAPALALPPPRVRALGYVRVEAQDRRRARLEAQAAGIEARCADHGMALAGLVSDDDADERAGPQRPGLAFALEQLETGEADCLVVGRLGHLTRSPTELASLLDTMAERETPLVVLNADPATAKRTRRWSAEREPQVRMPGRPNGRGDRDG
jgi:peptidoglycan hydrolase-like protein with peptidoglycan-binding domain